MEGLLPMMYKAIKRKRYRRRYKSLSSANSAPNSFDESWPIYMAQKSGDTSPRSRSAIQSHHHHHHRRHKSEGEYAFEMATVRGRDVRDETANYPTKEGQLMRFRSHRSLRNRMFSCVGVAY